jgi:signal peptidase I
MLVHGALAEYDGFGVIIAAPECTGKSMNPFLKLGDLLEVEHLNSKISRGDVIYFPSPGNRGMVVHRVVGTMATGV